MSTIKLSTGLLHYLTCANSTNTNFGGPFCTYSSSSAPHGFDQNNSKLRIFQGSLPSQNDIETIIPSSLRTSDRLITFATGGNWTVTNGIVTLSVNLPTAATASGTAAWFALTSTDASVAEAGGSQYLIGQITLPGGGGELVINDLNIVSGTTYTLGSITFTLPSTFSYP